MKKMYLRIISFVLCFVMTMGIMSGTIFAESLTNSASSAPKRQFKTLDSDKTFTLVDSEKGYFVVANDDYGIRAFDESGAWSFDPQSQTNIAYWLNNDFKVSGNDGKKLPPSILENIEEHEFSAGSGTTLAEIALISKEEIQTYSEIVGIKDSLNSGSSNLTEYKRYWTRTPGKNTSQGVYINFMGDILNANVTNQYLVRPVFYLADNFFSTVKLDTTYMGADVKRIITEACSDAELLSIGYSSEEIYTLKNGGDTIVSIRLRPDWTQNRPDDNDRSYKVDGKISFSLSVNNPSSGDVKYYYRWSVNGNSSPVHSVVTKAQTSAVHSIVLPVTVDGPYNIEVGISPDGQNFFLFPYYVNYVSTVEAADNRGYGVHFNQDKNPIDETIELLKASGVKTVRDDIQWGTIENTKGVYQWTSATKRLEALHNNDIDIILCLLGGNALYSYYETVTSTDENGQTVQVQQKITFGSEEEIQGFINWAVAVAEQFPWIRKFEFLNESNLSHLWNSLDGKMDVEKYKEVAKRLSVALKAVNSENELIVGAISDATLTEGATVYMTDLMEALLDDDLASYIDGISLHIYMSYHVRADLPKRYGETITQFQMVKNLMDKTGGFLKLYLTETGTFTGREGSGLPTSRQKSDEMVRIFTEADAAGFDYVMIYDFMQDGTDIDNPEHNYGVVTHTDAGFAPTEPYFGIKNFIDKIGNAEYMGEITLRDHVNGHVYMNDGEPVVVAWSDARHNETVVYDHNFGNIVELYDVMGKSLGKTREYSFDCQPVYIYGMNKSVAALGTANMAKAELEGLSQSLSGADFSSEISAVDNITCASDVYAVINDIYALSAQCEVEDYQKTRGNLSRLDTAAEYMAKTLCLYDDAEEMSSGDLIKAYENFEKTLNTVSLADSNGAKEVYEFGREVLDEVGSYVKEKYCVSREGEIYALSENRNLLISGTTQRGDIVNVKILSETGELEFVGSVTADAQGKYNLTVPMDEEWGKYSLAVKTSRMSEPYEGVIDYTEDEEYRSEKLKILYGKILRAENLLNISRNFLFRYANADNTLLVDVRWKTVGKDSAKAVCTVKNNSAYENAKIILAAYEEGRVSAVSCTDLELTSDKTEQEFEISFSKKPEKISAYVWDAEGLVPLAPRYDY